MTAIIPLSSDKVVLRNFEPEDIPALDNYLNHPDLNGKRYIPGRYPDTLPLSKQQVEGIYKHWVEADKQVTLAVTMPGGGDLIGHTQCDWRWDRHCAYISVVIAPDHQQQGYGGEVINILLDYLFGYTQVHNVSSGMASWNKTALQFSFRQGFTQIGAMRHAGLRGGEYYDWIGVDILRPEWQSGKGG